jgi:hypothetical protein
MWVKRKVPGDVVRGLGDARAGGKPRCRLRLRWPLRILRTPECPGPTGEEAKAISTALRKGMADGQLR